MRSLRSSYALATRCCADAISAESSPSGGHENGSVASTTQCGGWGRTRRKNEPVMLTAKEERLRERNELETRYHASRMPELRRAHRYPSHSLRAIEGVVTKSSSSATGMARRRRLT
jgi:hypothetical protein